MFMKTPEPYPAGVRTGRLADLVLCRSAGPTCSRAGWAFLVCFLMCFLNPEPCPVSRAQECAQGGPLTSFVSERWASPQPNGLVLSEAEARYLFRVRRRARADNGFWVL